MRTQRNKERGASLTEFAIVIPVIVAMFYGSVYLTELGAFKLKSQEIARYSAWAFTQHPLSAYDDENLKHNDAWTRARDSVADELADVYSDLDGARDRTLPIEGAWGQTMMAVYQPPSGFSGLSNRPAQVLPSWGQMEWAEPLSGLGMALSILGFGTGTESLASGPASRLRFNNKGQITARANVKTLPPILPNPERALKATAMAKLGGERGADFSPWFPSGREIRDDRNRRMESTLLVDSWRIHDGFSAHPKRSPMSGYARMVGEVSDNGIKALPGGQLIGWLTGLGDQLKKLPPGLTVLFGFQPPDPESHLLSRPYSQARTSSRPNPKGQVQRGQVDIFRYTGANRAQESDAVTNFETSPLFLDARGDDKSYYEALKRRGNNFMGCKQPEERGCWE
jgi:hypothetical protein